MEEGESRAEEQRSSIRDLRRELERTSAKNPDEKYKSRIASLGAGCGCLSFWYFVGLYVCLV